MKKARAIILRTNRLRDIRNQLRVILKLWASDIRMQLMDVASSYSKQRNLSESRKVRKQISKIRLAEKLSILLCLYCGNRDKDMVFVPQMKQWLCIDCYAEILHYENLRKNLDMTEGEIREFFERLTSEEGIALSRKGLRCHEYHYSKLILDRMGIPVETQSQFFELCKYYGGYCDCEIFFNAKLRFLE